MLYQSYFKKNKVNQLILNRKINWFFDIKSIIYNKIDNKLIKKYANQINYDFAILKKKNINQSNNIRKSFLSKKIKFSKFIKNDKNFKKKIINLIRLITKAKSENYLKHFIVHGSIASEDYVKNWSDFDTFVVIKDDTLKDVKKIIKLRKILKKIYLKILNFSKFQHHGLIFYTESDLKNYLSGYLPKEAMDKNFNIFRNEKVTFFQNKKKNNISLEYIKKRKNFLKLAVKKKLYDHHTINNNIMKLPVKANDPYMFQLIYHITSMLNVPILFLDSIGKSSHKKKSFKKFYKIVKDKFVIKNIRKNENLRKMFKEKQITNNKIPSWLIKKIDVNYFLECAITLEKTLIKINKIIQDTK